ncbi:hypothetical protein KIL84_006584 [Mauremys mutica]|uniref:Uncharacterized protein n=1 Tax=Mauremys mutica TaxID=74926 RepID=A0A9D3X173_9SAUR|nr:hypothetical protein KIL84_006584 [Mauremys mutica]
MRGAKLNRIIKGLVKGAAIDMGSSGTFARGRIKRLQCMIFYRGRCCSQVLGTALLANWGSTVSSYQTSIFKSVLGRRSVQVRTGLRGCAGDLFKVPEPMSQFKDLH